MKFAEVNLAQDASTSVRAVFGASWSPTRQKNSFIMKISFLFSLLDKIKQILSEIMMMRQTFSTNVTRHFIMLGQTFSNKILQSQVIWLKNLFEEHEASG